MSNDLIRRYVARSLPIVATFGLASTAAHAWDFQNADGTVTGSWDTTLTFGQAWRIESRDCRLIAIADGGCGRSPNIDDGNLNWDTDMYSQALKALTEISLNFKNAGVFVRASALYDNVADDTDRTRLTPEAEDLVKSYVRLLDTFAYVKFDMGKMNAELRLGRQVVSWGESTFIQNGINVINPIDVSKLRVAGAELKEAFLPQEMVNFSVQFTDSFSAQAIYITDWNATCRSRRARTSATPISRPRVARKWCWDSARSRTRAWTWLAGRALHHQFPDGEPPRDGHAR